MGYETWIYFILPFTFQLFLKIPYQYNFYIVFMYYIAAKTQAKIPKQMRTFEDSQKSKKTVASMIERKGEEKSKKQGNCYIILFKV